MRGVGRRAVERYVAVVEIAPDEDGGYVATAPALPGCISQGRTMKEAQENMEEAMSLYLEVALEADGAVPPRLVAATAVATIDVRGKSVSAGISAWPDACGSGSPAP